MVARRTSWFSAQRRRVVGIVRPWTTAPRCKSRECGVARRGINQMLQKGALLQL